MHSSMQEGVGSSNHFDAKFALETILNTINNKFKKMHLSSLMLIIAPNDTCQISLVNLYQLSAYIKENIDTTGDLAKFINFFSKLSDNFIADDICKIIFAFAKVNLSFARMLSSKFLNHLDFNTKLLVEFARTTNLSTEQNVTNYIKLGMLSDIKKIEFLLLKFNNGSIDTEKRFLTVKFNLMLQNLDKGKFYMPFELSVLRNLFNSTTRSSLGFKRNLSTALVKLSENNIICQNAHIDERTEYLAIFISIVRDSWVDPIVAKDALVELHRLGFIQSLADAYSLLQPVINNPANGTPLVIENKHILISYWFASEALVSLWQKVDKKYFNRFDFFSLLDDSQRKYMNSGVNAISEIQQLVFDKLKSIVLNKQYKSHHDFAKFIKDIPENMRTIYLANFLFKIKNRAEASNLLFKLPNNIIELFLQGSKITLWVSMSRYIEQISNNIEKLLSDSNKSSDEIYKKVIFHANFELAISKVLFHLENKSSNMAMFACGLLLLNGWDSNPRNLDGDALLAYQEKRMHDAITYLNLASGNSLWRCRVTEIKTSMFANEPINSSVLVRLRDEIHAPVPRLLSKPNDDDTEDSFSYGI